MVTLVSTHINNTFSFCQNDRFQYYFVPGCIVMGQ